MSINKVYASFELADREVRLIVLEIFEGQFNVLRVLYKRFAKQAIMRMQHWDIALKELY